MKFCLLLIIASAFQANAIVYAQNVSIDVKNAPIHEVLKQLKKQTGYDFLFATEDLTDIKPVSLSLKNKPLYQVLEACFSDYHMSYSIDMTTVLIRRSVHYNYQAPVSGTVTDKDGIPLIGASITVKGKAAMGVSTNNVGAFSLTVPENAILVFSYMGYKSMEVVVGNRSKIDVILELISKDLDDVVVTALGITKDRKALGYSVTEVKGESLIEARETNVMNSLVGRVAGLNVNSVSGGPGSSVNILIRGMSSLTQNNQPLYVINGIPMSNETSSGKGQYFNAPDIGDNISNINPDDIESISVLKGAAASALYGSQAKAGVIMITTKSGKENAKASIELNSNYVLESIVDPTDFQYEYGQGTTSLTGGAIVQNKPATAANALTSGRNSWGPKMDGELYIQADGVMRPYSAARNNLDKFYRTGGTWTNTLSFTKGFTGGSVRLSASNIDSKNVVPNSGLDRQTFNFSSNYELTKRLSIDVRANYILQNGKNRARLGDAAGNAANGILPLATTINIDDFKDATYPDGSEKNISGSTFTTNPWFAANNFLHNTNRNRLISSATLSYKFDNGVLVKARASRDFYNDRYKSVTPNGTAYMVLGQMEEQIANSKETYADLLINKDFNISSDFTLSSNLGASFRNIKSERFTVSGSGFTVPYVYYIGNLPTRIASYALSEEEMHALYGTLELNYKKLLYVTGTARTDWFSTLATPGFDIPVHKFYPSVSGSFIFSELLKNASWLNFGKLRLGYAEVGQATRPYQTQLSYNFNALSLSGMPLGQISSATVPNAALSPSTASELEIGTEIRLLDNRIILDLAYYKKISKNEIVDAPISIASGYTLAQLNIGKLQNKGFEALVTFTPVKNRQFSWSSSVNGTLNNNLVLALAPDNNPLNWATSRSGTAFIRHIIGLPAAQVVGYDYDRDENGEIKLNASNGLPVRSTVLTPHGSAYHKYIAGWTNSFKYKNWNFDFLIDGKFGGKIYSQTEAMSYANGLNKATLVGREDIWGKNQTAQGYYNNLSNISALFIKDASFIKFRQVTLGYKFAKEMFNKNINNLKLSLVGRNLFVIMKKTGNIDPESAYTGAAQGLEYGALPPQRTLGINLSANF